MHPFVAVNISDVQHLIIANCFFELVCDALLMLKQILGFTAAWLRLVHSVCAGEWATSACLHRFEKTLKYAKYANTYTHVIQIQITLLSIQFT